MKLEDAIQSTRFTNMRHKASLNLMYTNYWLKTHVTAALKPFGLTPEQYNVLRILRGKHPESRCVKDIGTRMIEKNSNVPRIIDKLVAKKLVKRSTSKEDKRETIMTLTDKGIEILEQAMRAADEISEKILGLTEEEALQLNELLEKMRKD
jgi:DNA-binding MarR family transcriptional regulator